jgi:uncharacterized lipoprotein YajG
MKIGFPSLDPDRDERPAGFAHAQADTGTMPTVRTKGTLVAMKKARAIVPALLLVLLAACASPPQAEIDAAKAALASALQNPDVITYAPDSLRTAADKMDALDAEVAAQARRSALSRNYDLTRTLAAEASALARAANETATSSKQQVSLEASALLDEVTAAIQPFESRLWVAKRVPRIKLDVIAPLQQLPEQARATLADAQKDIAAGAFASAKAKLSAVRERLSASTEIITEQTRIARSR